jgi:hypothetical protein
MSRRWWQGPLPAAWMNRPEMPLLVLLGFFLADMGVVYWEPKVLLTPRINGRPQWVGAWGTAGCGGDRSSHAFVKQDSFQTMTRAHHRQPP